MLEGAEGARRQLRHVVGVEPAVWPEGVRVGAPDQRVAVDEPLARVDAQAVDAGQHAGDLDFEVAGGRDEAGGAGGRVQAQRLFDHRGRVRELAAEDAVGFAGAAEEVCGGGGAGAEDEIMFLA